VIREMRSSSESTSHCHLQQSLDWKEQANGLASQVTGLTPMVFFLWGHIKVLIYTSPVDSEEDLIVHIVETAGT
jgi:hypothetical protein